jgi:hypothetical protein
MTGVTYSFTELGKLRNRIKNSRLGNKLLEPEYTGKSLFDNGLCTGESYCGE